MIRPIKSYTRISTHFKEGVPPHKGIDYAAPEGQAILSPVNGAVTQSYLSGLVGNTLEIREDNGRLHRLLHLKSKFPVKGDRVREGQLVGFSGGRKGAKYSGTLSTGPHLHWDVRKAGSLWNDLSAYVDPELTLKASQKPVVKAVYYIVQKGDWLSKIAQRAHTTVRALLKLNPQIKNPDVIHPKDKIRTK
jgi:murein DD-endopeptidase MepM/ murein hydrolase activator NlpD